MKIAILALFAILFFVPTIYAQQDNPFGDPSTDNIVIEYVKPVEMLKLMQEDGNPSYVLVDTQPPEAFAEGHIKGAINYPWTDHLSLPVTLPRNKMLILYCACNHDEDSIDMVKRLAQFGYLNTKVLEGGWFKWELLNYPQEGKPVVQPKGDITPAEQARITPFPVLVSGRQVGEPIPSFRVIDVTGKYKGQPSCYVCDYGEKPEVVAFFKTASPETEALIVKLNQLAKQQPTLNFEVILVAPTAKLWLERLAVRDKITIPLTYLRDGQKDIGIHVAKLNLATLNTTVIGTNRLVVANFVNLNPMNFWKLSEAAKAMLK
jgi:rhodanese-related sulfurtransferase